MREGHEAVICRLQVIYQTPQRVRMLNWPFPSSPGPLFQDEVKCSAFDMETISHSHANKTHFHKKGCAPSLILKVRVFGTLKWPIGTIEKINLRAATQPFKNS